MWLDLLMEEITVRDALLNFYEEVGLAALIGGREALAQALDEIAAELGRIAMDAHVATTRKLSLTKAASNFDDFPHLAKFHNAVTDMLSMSLPPELVPLVRKAIAMADSRAARE